MEPFIEGDDDFDEQDIEILVDVLRQCFFAEKARYHLPEFQDTLMIEIQGLEEFSQTEIIEISEPVLTEFDLDFEEIALLPMRT